jgi:hypothetical protein
VTRYRRGVPGNGTPHLCKEVMRKARGDFEAALRELSGQDGHVHLLVSCPPKVSASALVNSLKDTPAGRLRPEHTGKANPARGERALLVPVLLRRFLRQCPAAGHPASTPGSRSAWPDSQAGAYPALKDGACAPNLVTQPYRLGRTRTGSDEASLDAAWTALWPLAAGPGVPVISGGRSAGSQVACRTAVQLGAHAVLALAYPLLGPGSPTELLATGRPTLVIQGSSDPFGQFPELPPEIELVEIPTANHTFGTPDASSATMDLITDATSRWIERQLPRA